MITCAQARENLDAFYDGECPEALRRDLIAHLSTCRACQNELDQWVALSAKLFPLTKPEAPAFLWTRVLAGIEAREAERAAWWYQWRWMSRVTIAAALLVGLGATFLWRQAAPPLEAELEGRDQPQEAIQLASAYVSHPSDSLTAVLEGGSWAEN